MHELRCARIIRKYVAISPLESRTGHDGAKALIVVLSDPVANLNQPRLPICIRQRNTCVLLGTVGVTVEIVAFGKRITKVLGQLRGNGRFSAAGNTHDDDVSWGRWHAANSTAHIRGVARFGVARIVTALGIAQHIIGEQDLHCLIVSASWGCIECRLKHGFRRRQLIVAQRAELDAVAARGSTGEMRPRRGLEEDEGHALHVS